MKQIQSEKILKLSGKVKRFATFKQDYDARPSG